MEVASSRFSRGDSSAGPRRLAALLAAAAAILVPLAATAPPAGARPAHGPVAYEFGPDGLPGSSFGSIGTLAFQQSSKRLYAQAEYQIDAFSHPSTGSFVPAGEHFPVSVSTGPYFSALAADNTSGPTAGHVFWTGEYNEIVGLHSTGESLSPGFPIIPQKQTCGLAVDSEGNIWAGSYQNESVYEYGPEGGPLLRTVYTPEVGRNCKVAIDPNNDNLYVGSYTENKVAEITAASNYTTETVFEGLPSSNLWVTVDGAAHILFAATPYSPEVREYSTITGEQVGSFMVSGGVHGIAVEEVTGTLFISVEYYEPVSERYLARIREMPQVEVPVATTEEPVGNSTVSGTADPDGAGPITECYFEYGTEAPAYGQKEECEQATPLTTATQVTAKLSLLGERTYHYRLVLANAEGEAVGADETVQPHNIIGFKTTAASNVTRTTAQLTGEFEGTNEDTTYKFEYGESESYGHNSGSGDAGVTTGPTAFSEEATGLSPDTTYHFRATGKNSKGPNLGGDLTFHTLPAVVGLKPEKPTEVTKTSAVLSGSFAGNGEATEYFFQWGESESYGHSTPVESAGNGTGTISVSAEIQGLEADSPSGPQYHFRLVAKNAVGTTSSADLPFTTEGPEAPTVSGQQATGVTSTGAMIGATINPSESETVFLVEYGISQAYGSTTAVSESIGSDSSDHQVSKALTNLIPGSAYHYRVVAMSFGGTAQGADQTFITPAPPRVESTKASDVTMNSARLHATIGAGGLPTTVSFEYGATAAYGSTTATQSLVGSLGFTEIEAALAGLSPGTTYHARVVATNAIQTVDGPDITLSTVSAPVEPKVVKCKKGFVKKHGKCVKKPKKPKHKKKRKHHRHG